MKALILFFLPALASTPSMAATCPFNEAFVQLEAKHAQQLITEVGFINSMPLFGKLKYQSGDLAGVVISVPESYARPNHLSGFDVAKKLEGFADTNRYGIRVIQATHCYEGAGDIPDDDWSNAGTIGHGRGR